MSKPLWGGRFSQNMDATVEKFNASINIDERLIHEDIQGSIAHVMMLKECEILSSEESELIINGLNSIQDDYHAGKVSFSESYEDIHLNIEHQLIERIGPTGGKMHTARSRNDQVATDMHLYALKSANLYIDKIKMLQTTLLQLSENNIDVIMPGYTHLQRAQPVLLSHHFMAYFWMLERDKKRMVNTLEFISISPLGSGALAGTTFPINQERTKELLNFNQVYPNSMDAVSDRDYILDMLHNINTMMMHLSRFCEELIIWSTDEFNFITLSDSFSTGSSIMPQKKNPDMLELIRGKAGTVTGNYVALLMTMKGLPMTYNKDMQEDKKGFFESTDTALDVLTIFNDMIATMKINDTHLKEVTENDFSNATELADYLTGLNIPFREAHEITGKLVLKCINENKLLKDVTLEEYQSLNNAITDEIYEVLKPESAVNRRSNLNGTSPESVKQQIEEGKKLIG